MKKRFFCLGLILLMLTLSTAATAATATYNFEGPRARLMLEQTGYDIVLTPATLDGAESWLTGKGIDFQQTKDRFEDTGVLLEAYDTANSRVLTVTALEDVNANELFDVNTLEDAERKKYRQSHSNGTFYGIQGYDYEKAEWKNYGSNLGRFLKLKYTQRIAGSIVLRGYQRRTVRNGYTITFDMQVTGRSLKAADEKALDRALNGFSFLEVLNSPVGACKLILTTEPEREVTSDKITIAGKSENGATVTATVISLTDNKTSTVSTTAGSKGKFSLSISLPQQGTYSIGLLAATEDGRSTQKSLTVMYQRDYIPLNLTSAIPSALSEDSLTVAGTTVSGVTVQISVSGPVTLQKSTKGKKFSFTVDTREEGTYQILLTATKKGMSPRSVSYTVTRSVTEAEKIERVKKNATSVKYSTLRKNISKYAGKMITLSGYVMEVRQVGEEYVVRLAVNRSGKSYQDFVYIVCRTDPGLSLEEHVRMYGTLSENMYVEIEEGGSSGEYPRFELMLFESLN